MEGMESVLEAVLGEEEARDEDETLDDDVEMLESLSLNGGGATWPAQEPAPSTGGGGGGGGGAGGGGQAAKAEPPGPKQARRAKKKKKKKNKRMKSTADSITDINRFVMNTCKHLKEKKPYLLWNAVGCLGVSAVRDLIKEVDIIQRCGGQRTADDSRLRTGGGILWNILKSREPKAYKEIMEKAREFEKQFKRPKRNQASKQIEEAILPSTHEDDGMATGVLDSSEHVPNTQQGLEPIYSDKRHTSVLSRIRMPVAYDDLYEEGEIHD